MARVCVGDRNEKGNCKPVKYSGGTLLSARVSQNSSNTFAASFWAFCALHIMEEFKAPIEDPAKMSNLMPCFASVLYAPHS